MELLSAALDAAGFEVLAFQNGEAAMASLEASPPSLVICEAMTPRLNGFVIRERLRASPGSTRSRSSWSPTARPRT